MGVVVQRTVAVPGERRAFAPIVPRPSPTVDPTAPTNPAALEAYARLMEDSGSFRVLRRLPARATTPLFKAPGANLGLFVDVETMGSDPLSTEVIELACVPFTFAASGRIVAVHEPVCQVRQPAAPTSTSVNELTGLNAQAVNGQLVREEPLLPLIAEAALVVAHHARWDRPIVERLIPSFADLPWGCSLTQVRWRDEDVSGQSLSAIANSLGFFFTAHRALDDCLAGIEILGRPLPRSGVPAMAELLRNAACETRRVWALNSPYEARQTLRRRGYNWSNGDDGRPRSWFIDVDVSSLDTELAFLRRDVFGFDTDPPVTRIGPYERFSARG